MEASPPPLPWDAFPTWMRLVGRPTLTELWRGCWQAGYDIGHGVGLAKGAALGIVGASAFWIALIAVALAAYHAHARSNRQ